MKKLLFLGLLAYSTLFFWSCKGNKDSVYKEVPEQVLKTGDSLVFNFNVSNPGPQQVTALLRYGEGYPFTSLLLSLQISTPDGKKYNTPLVFNVRDSSGKYIGEVAGDLYDLEQKAMVFPFPEKGEYKFRVGSMMPVTKVPMVLELGFRLTPVSMQGEK